MRFVLVALNLQRVRWFMKSTCNRVCTELETDLTSLYNLKHSYSSKVHMLRIRKHTNHLAKLIVENKVQSDYSHILCVS
jgi:hypothetical protein